MTFDEYQKLAGKTASDPNIGQNFVYPTLGCVGEAGEVEEKVKKIFRDEGGVVTDQKKEDIKKELGDVLWYLSRVSVEFGISLDEVACFNIKKLSSRKERGKIKGDGDSR